MEETKDILLVVTAKHNRMVKRMQQLGIKNVAELCRRMGEKKGTTTKQVAVGKLINFKQSPFRQDSLKSGSLRWRPVVEKMAEALECLPEDLFPKHLQELLLENNRSAIELNLEDARQLYATTNAVPLPDEVFEQKELALVLESHLLTLRPRVAEAVRLYFALGGEDKVLKEVGESLSPKITKEAARQLIVRGLRELRRPIHADELRSFYKS